MDYTADIHIEEATPPHCSIPLYRVSFNGEVLLDCMGLEEIKEVKLGELIEFYEED